MFGPGPRDDGPVSENRRGWPYEPVGGRGAPAPAPPGLPHEEEPAAPSPVETPTVSRRAVVLLSIAAALALVLGALAVGDWWVRNREMQTLLDRIERAERAQIPARDGIGPRLLLCQQEPLGDDAERCDTVGIREIAERSLPRLVETGEEVAGTRLTSVHGSLRTFRDRYVDHNLAWRSWLELLARDPTAGNFGSPDDIDTTFEVASDAADDALTPLPLDDNRARVEAVFSSVR